MTGYPWNSYETLLNCTLGNLLRYHTALLYDTVLQNSRWFRYGTCDSTYETLVDSIYGVWIPLKVPVAMRHSPTAPLVVVYNTMSSRTRYMTLLDKIPGG